jgi:hypothetical protein
VFIGIVYFHICKKAEESGIIIQEDYDDYARVGTDYRGDGCK